ncbi:MAG TPA: hypothetical protein VGO93_20000, partial [Candidatus Xenobia bacterium]
MTLDESQDMLSQRWGWSDLMVAMRRVMLAATAIGVGLAPCFLASSDDNDVGPVVLLGAVLLVLLSGWVLLSRRLPRSEGPPLAAALWGWMALSAAASSAPFHSHRLLACWGAGVAVLLGLVLARPSLRELRHVTLGIVTAAAAMCLVTWLRVPLDPTEPRFTGMYTNSDCFGILLAMAMALGAGLLPLARGWQNGLILVDMFVLAGGLVA